MSLNSLLVSRDSGVVGVFQPLLKQLHIQSEVCSDAGSAAERLIAQKFDAVIVDYDGMSEAAAFLHQLRANRKNREAITFAVTQGKSNASKAFCHGANFVIDQPLNLDWLNCNLRVAHELMLRGRRRSLRRPVDVPAELFQDGKSIPVRLVNISEEGAAFNLDKDIVPYGEVRLHVEIPGGTQVIEAEADLAWADCQGHAGVRFVELSDASARRLTTWLGLIDAQTPDLDLES